MYREMHENYTLFCLKIVPNFDHFRHMWAIFQKILKTFHFPLLPALPITVISDISYIQMQCDVTV